MKLSHEDAERIKNASLANIIKRIKEGGTLTANERKMVDESTKEAEESARAKLNHGTTILRKVSEIINSSKLTPPEKREIFFQLSQIET